MNGSKKKWWQCMFINKSYSFVCTLQLLKKKKKKDKILKFLVCPKNNDRTNYLG